MIMALVLGILWIPSMASAGEFIIKCPYSHSLKDDPIVHFGVPGASHWHDFFGNETTNANSTYDSLRAGTTTCLLDGDTAAYWVPAWYWTATGVKISPVNVRAYYTGGTNAVTPPARIQMIGGDSAAPGPQDKNIVNFTCGANNNFSRPV